MWKWSESGSRSVVSDSLWPHGLTIQSIEFSRPEYCSGQPFPSPGALPNPGIEPRSLTLQMFSLPADHKGRLRILEWVAYPFSRGSSWLRNQTGVSCIAGGFCTNWAIRKALDYAKELKSQPGYGRLPRIFLFWLNVKMSQLHTSKINIHTLDGQMLILTCLLCSHLLSRVWFFATPWTVTQQAPLSMGFSRQEYLSGLLFPTPGELPDPGIKLASLVSPTLADGVFTAEPTGKTNSCVRAKLLQSYLILCDPMDSTPPGSTVHGIFQARILEWVAVPSSRGSSQPRDRTPIS